MRHDKWKHVTAVQGDILQKLNVINLRRRHDEDLFEQWKLHESSLPVGLQVRAPSAINLSDKIDGRRGNILLVKLNLKIILILKRWHWCQ